MRKHDLVVTTIAVTATMLMSAVGYTNVDKYDLGTVQVKAEAVQGVNDTVPEDVDKTPKWTSSFSITYVREGDALTEKVLGLDTSYHLVDEPYVCNQVGTFDLSFLTYSDTRESYGLIRGRVVVEKSKTYTQPPQVTEAPLTEDDKKVLDFISKGTIELDVEAGHPNITFKSLGLEETDRFTYEYSGDVIEVKNKVYAGVYKEYVTIFDNAKPGDTYDVNIIINVIDKEAPVLSGVKDSIKVIGGSDLKKKIMKGVRAHDDNDGNRKVSISGYKPKYYNKVQKVTFKATDKSGNTVEKTVDLKIVNPIKKINNKIMYATVDMRLHDAPRKRGGAVLLLIGERVKVIAMDRNTGWYKVKFTDEQGWYGGKTFYGWLNSKYLSSKEVYEGSVLKSEPDSELID